MNRAAIVIVAALACVAAIPVAAEARIFTSSEPLRPLHYRYAACVYRQDAPTADDQIANCDDLRETLTATGEEVLAQYHLRTAADRRRDLERGFDLMDAEAREALSEGNYAPPQVLDFLECMADGIMASDTYRSGNSIDYVGVERGCRAANRNTDGLQRDEERAVRLLLERFRVGDRMLNGPDDDWPDLRWRDGFIDLDLLPAR